MRLEIYIQSHLNWRINNIRYIGDPENMANNGNNPLPLAAAAATMARSVEIELQYLYTGDEPLMVPAELANFALAGSAIFDIRDTFFDTGDLELRLPDAVPDEPVHAIRLDGVVPQG